MDATAHHWTIVWLNKAFGINDDDSAELASLTYFPSGALVVERAEGDGRQQNGDVEEDGRGGVLQ